MDQISERELNLVGALVTAAGSAKNSDVRRHVREGLTRRVLMMQASRTFIGDMTARGTVLTPTETEDFNVHLNAFYLNICGALDNWAWAIAYRCELREGLDEHDNACRRFVSLFGKAFQNALESVRPTTAANLKPFAGWYSELRDYRDPAAHRIPLYTAPADVTPADIARQDQLEAALETAINARNYAHALEIHDQLNRLGSLSYVHALSASEGYTCVFR
jgi:hypothetical protein